MICPKCGSPNNVNAKFCSKCGAPLIDVSPQIEEESFFKKNKILILCVAIIVVVGAAVGAFALTMNNVPLQTHNFGAFSMSVPVGSDFVENFNVMNLDGGFVTYENNGKYNNDVFFFEITSSSFTIPPDSFALDSKDGDLTIYKSTDGNNGYIVERHIGSYVFGIMGFNLDVLKEMARSIKVTGTISNDNPTPTVTVPTSQTPTSNTPLKIISGSFSTGSELEDKTYATIYVGSQHAGEKVIVQIFYSRDGSTLNNGNLVPVTVDSSGYISVSSADAYSVYPDYATIKLYDANQVLQDTLSVSLSPTSGTQTF